MDSKKVFSAWLNAEMKKQGLSQSDLSRKSGLHRAIISKMCLAQSDPLPKTLIKIAKGLGLSSEEVFVAAGVLPENKEDPRMLKVSHLFGMLNPAKQETAIRIIEAMVVEERERK
jgi:transcriptional regulator with XRE-family HTH domain